MNSRLMTTRSFRRRLPCTAALAVVVLAAPACGSSNESSSDTGTPAGWADAMCSSVAKWKTSIKSAGDSLKNTETLSKATVEKAATTVSDANDKLASDLETLGPPPKPPTDEAKAAVEDLKSQLKTSASQINTAIKNVSGAADALQAVSVVSGALVTMSNDISATLAKLQSLNTTDEWKKAFADSDACQSLGKS